MSHKSPEEKNSCCAVLSKTTSETERKAPKKMKRDGRDRESITYGYGLMKKHL
jgi:hypothetical protein